MDPREGEGGQNSNDGRGDDGNAGAITVLDEDCRTEIGTVTHVGLDSAGDGGTELGAGTDQQESPSHDRVREGALGRLGRVSQGLAQDEAESIIRRR